MKSKQDKLLMDVGGKPLIYYSIMSFHDRGDIDTLTIVCNKDNKPEIEKIINTYHFPRVSKIVIGGISRMDSLLKGMKSLEKIAKKDDLILVHNAANPLPSQEEIEAALYRAQEEGACIVGHYLKSTIKEISTDQIIKTHDRSKLFAAQTPQIAKYGILKKALDNAIKKKLEVTDESMLLEAINQPVVYVEASENNFKVTTEADYIRLKGLIGELPSDYRVGIGQDSHMFEESQKGLVLAGIEFKDELKLKANSDGDVILHAIFNAISQAIGEMSLGFYADELCEKGVKDSKKYLETVLKSMKKQKFKINSLGLMIECKTPKIDPVVSKMKKSLSAILDLPPARIGITATTGEELTIFGHGLGIQCFAIISLKKA